MKGVMGVVCWDSCIRYWALDTGKFCSWCIQGYLVLIGGEI